MKAAAPRQASHGRASGEVMAATEDYPMP